MSIMISPSPPAKMDQVLKGSGSDSSSIQKFRFFSTSRREKEEKKEERKEGTDSFSIIGEKNVREKNFD